jgi:hypothetical protein
MELGFGWSVGAAGRWIREMAAGDIGRESGSDTIPGISIRRVESSMMKSTANRVRP